MMRLKTLALIFILCALFITAQAKVLVDSNPAFYSQYHKQNPLVFTDNKTGYYFYIDSSYNLIYKKTTDGGDSWGSAVTLQSSLGSEAASPSVWYDKWTPGDNSGTIIHIIYQIGGATDQLYYISFDTADDSASTAASVNAGNTGDYQTQNSNSIVKATDGVLYSAIVDDVGSKTFVTKCSTTCTNSGNWSDMSTQPFSDGIDGYIQLLPIANGDVMGLEWKTSTNTLNYSIYDESAGTWSALTQISSGTYTSYFYQAWGSTINRTTNDVYLVFSNHYDDGADIECWLYSGGTWTQKGNYANNQSNRLVRISYDETKNRVFLAREDYNAQEIYTSYSDDDMDSWAAETLLASASMIHYGSFSINLMSPEKIYLIWHEYNNSQDLYGQGVANIFDRNAVIFSSP